MVWGLLGMVNWHDENSHQEGRTTINLVALQTLITGVEVVLNDRPLTYVTSDVTEVEPLTPAHMLYGRRITSLLYPQLESEEIDDPDFITESEVRKRTKTQALRLQQFESWWKREYLTQLRGVHKSTGNNNQSVKVGDVVLIHNYNPRIQWRMAVVESLITGADGLVHAVNIRTSNGRTNRLITKLYPLEVTATTDSQTDEVQTVDDIDTPQQPKRNAAQKASQRISD